MTETNENPEVTTTHDAAVPSAAAFTISKRGAFLFYNGGYHAVGMENPQFENIRKALAEKDFEKAVELMDPTYGLNKWAKDFESEGFAVKAGIVYVDDKPFNEIVSGKALNMMGAGLAPDSLRNFLRKVRLNPSSSAQNELLLFCEASNFPIHEDGDIIAFKGVKDDYTDKHTGTFDNSVGKTVSMPRNEVDDRRDVTCSFGLHFGTHEQAMSYGTRSMVVKVNPVNVVSIPSDYNNSKGRCCEYVVMSELPQRAPLVQKEVYTNSDFNASRFVDETEFCVRCEGPSDELDYDGHCPDCSDE